MKRSKKRRHVAQHAKSQDIAAYNKSNDKYGIIRVMAGCVMAASLLYIGSTLIDSAMSNKTSAELSVMHSDGMTRETVVIEPELPAEVTYIPSENEEPDFEIIDFEDDDRVILPSMQNIYAANSDTVGWISVPNTKVDYPVVQTTDNEFYLSHDFYKAASQPGTIFADHRAVVNDYDAFQSDVITLYGHKQYDNTMFGSLHNYHNNLAFYKENPTFVFSNLYDIYIYKIVSVFLCKTDDSWLKPDEEVFDFQNYIEFDDSRSYDKFVSNIKQRSEINIDVDIEPTDKFMMLSTCAYEYKGARFVVVGRRVRDGESAIVDTSNAVKNENRLE